MATAESYRETVNRTRVEEIRSICRELPQACADFLRSIALVTGTLTRLAYAIDLRTFFSFYMPNVSVLPTNRSRI